MRDDPLHFSSVESGSSEFASAFSPDAPHPALTLPAPSRSVWPTVVTLVVATPSALLTGIAAGWPVAIIAPITLITLLSCRLVSNPFGGFEPGAVLHVMAGSTTAPYTRIQITAQDGRQLCTARVSRCFASPWAITWTGERLPTTSGGYSWARKRLQITVRRRGLSEADWRLIMRSYQADRFAETAHLSGKVAEK